MKSLLCSGTMEDRFGNCLQIGDKINIFRSVPECNPWTITDINLEQKLLTIKANNRTSSSSYPLSSFPKNGNHLTKVE